MNNQKKPVSNTQDDILEKDFTNEAENSKREVKEKKVSSEKKDSNIFNKRILTFGISGFLVLLLAVGILFIPVGNQLVLARILDTFGDHRAALSVDLLASADDFSAQSEVLMKFAEIDLENPESCGEIWNLNTYNLADYSKVAGAVSGTIYPDNDYKENFYIEGYLAGNVNVDETKVFADIDTTANFDIRRWNELDEEFGNGSNSLETEIESIQAKIDGSLYLSTDNYLFDLNRLGLFGDKIQGGIFFKYADTTGLNDAQKESFAKISSEIIEIMSTTPQDILSEDTGKALFSLVCSGIETVEVQNPSDIEFGYGEYKTIKQVRPVEFTLREDSEIIYLENSGDFLEKLFNDNKFRGFVKDQYPQIKSIYDNFVEIDKQEQAKNPDDQIYNSLDTALNISPLSSSLVSPISVQQVQDVPGTVDLCGVDGCPIIEDTFPDNQYGDIATSQPYSRSYPELTQTGYDNVVDVVFNSFNRSEYDTIINELVREYEESREYVKVEIRPLVYYIGMDDKQVYGYKQEIKINIEDSAWGLVNSESSNEYGAVREILKDGIVIKIDSFNNSFGDRVDNFEVPDKVQ